MRTTPTGSLRRSQRDTCVRNRAEAGTRWKPYILDSTDAESDDQFKDLDLNMRTSESC